MTSRPWLFHPKFSKTNLKTISIATFTFNLLSRNMNESTNAKKWFQYETPRRNLHSILFWKAKQSRINACMIRHHTVFVDYLRPHHRLTLVKLSSLYNIIRIQHRLVIVRVRISNPANCVNVGGLTNRYLRRDWITSPLSPVICCLRIWIKSFYLFSPLLPILW